MEPAFLHVATSAMAARELRKLLKQLRLPNRVVTLRDFLHVGPLRDVDSAGVDRVEWWKTVHGDAWDPSLAAALDDSAALRRIAKAKRLLVWDGPHPGEWLCARRVCAFARGEVHEVALPPHRSRHLAPFYGALAIVGAKEALPHWKHRSRVPSVKVRAASWKELVERSGDGIRMLENDRIVEHPITRIDDTLLASCGDWIRTTRAVGTVMTDWPVGDIVVAWRVRKLLKAGVLTGRGDAPPHLHRAWSGVPAEIRAH